MSIPEISCDGKIDKLDDFVLMLCLFQFETMNPIVKAETIFSPLHPGIIGINLKHEISIYPFMYKPTIKNIV